MNQPFQRPGELLGTLMAYRRVLRAAIISHPAPAALLQAIPMLREQAIAVLLGEPGPDEAIEGLKTGMSDIEALIQELHPGA